MNFRIINIYLILFFSNLLTAQSIDNRINNVKTAINYQDNIIDSLNLILENLELERIRLNIKENFLPTLNKDEELIEHSAMFLVYNEQHEQASWVIHCISTNIIDGKIGRTNNFRKDTLIKTGSSEEKDFFTKYKNKDGKYIYNGFGYDRGHLAPSADFRWSKTALSESYLYSNMSPQLAEFNREGWANLEGLIRAYVKENKQNIIVITGPIFNETVMKVEESKNNISIPDSFFKIVLDYENKIALGFLIPHKQLDYPIEYYAVTIDEIEELTNIDFFSSLSEHIEQHIESQKNITTWLPKRSKTDFAPLNQKELPKNAYNTVQARQFSEMGKKVKICGTVVSTYLSKNGHTFINLDKSFPNAIFGITIWESKAPNFSYIPHIKLERKKVCVIGKITENRGTPTMNIEHEKSIIIIED